MHCGRLTRVEAERERTKKKKNCGSLSPHNLFFKIGAKTCMTIEGRGPRLFFSFPLSCSIIVYDSVKGEKYGGFYLYAICFTRAFLE